MEKHKIIAIHFEYIAEKECEFVFMNSFHLVNKRS